MTENSANFDNVAGVPLSVFKVLSIEDQNFLRAMEKIGVDLEVIYEKITRELGRESNCK